MRYYVRLEDWVATLDHYWVCVDELRIQFEAAPSMATVALYNRLHLDPK
jgi:hypothetical protein